MPLFFLLWNQKAHIWNYPSINLKSLVLIVLRKLNYSACTAMYSNYTSNILDKIIHVEATFWRQILFRRFLWNLSRSFLVRSVVYCFLPSKAVKIPAAAPTSDFSLKVLLASHICFFTRKWYLLFFAQRSLFKFLSLTSVSRRGNWCGSGWLILDSS